MQQVLAAASFAVSLLLVVASIAAGWVVLWYTTLRDIGLFRDLMGLNSLT
ncbi:MAG: hypothetical protein J3K34DRAFT_473439 [Monoraphidium minutum]|nr:MAG: hypothetical protein J3K34DRAFT_473439 [Monoraphidium minutum]